MLELDLLIGKYAKENIPNLSTDQCKQYEQEILTAETPDLYKWILGKEKAVVSSFFFIEKIKEEMGVKAD